MAQGFQLIAGSVCLDFINTLDNRSQPERRIDLLESYRDLIAWALQAELINHTQQHELLQMSAAQPQEATTAFRKAIALREDLYRIFARAADHRRPATADLLSLNSYLADTFSQLRLQPKGTTFRLGWCRKPARLDSLLWPIVRSATDLLTSPELERVRKCGVNTCRWLFLDRSKNHTRRWCDMKLCGNRTKARNFYFRQKSRI